MMMNNERYNEKVDVWSFGMVVYELTSNKIPYDYCQNNIPFLVLEVVVNKKTPPIPEGIEIHPILRELMKQCLNWDTQQRPSFTQIIQTLRDASDKQLTTQSQTNIPKGNEMFH
jgi:sterile alpha motif and leucine zipper-containing kinase AZK